MSLFTMLIIYLFLGAFTGFMSGMIGIGGGIIMVPAFSFLFAKSNFVPVEDVMHMAIGTSLAVVVVTSLSGLRAYHERGAVRWDVIKQIVLSVVIGTMLGVVIANYLPSKILQILFAVFLVMVGLQLLLTKPHKEINKEISKKMMRLFAGMIGGLSSILGIGGGVILVPFLLRCQLHVREAAGTSLACGMVIGIVSSASFMVSGFKSGQHVPLSTGYIYWPAFLSVALAGVLCAPIGTWLAHKLPTLLLKKIFAVIVLVVAVRMMMHSCF